MVSSATPLWRNGPSDKPVLCNACGSRYRLWGTLDNYLPKHCQPEQLNKRKSVKGRSNLNVKYKRSSYVPYSGAISLWNCKIPSKKRSRVVYKRMTPMEKFQKQLLNLWRYDIRPNESPQEEVLLIHNVNNFVPSNEIGFGGILLKPDGTST